MTMLSFERAAAAASPVRSAIRLGGLHLQLPAAAAAALIASPPLRFGARGRSPEQLAHYRKEKKYEFDHETQILKIKVPPKSLDGPIFV